MPDRRWTRWRVRVEDWFAVVVLIAVIFATVGGYVAYTAHVAPGTTTQQQQVSSWSGDGAYNVTASVAEPNPVYPVGTELSDRPLYFLSASPIANTTFGFQYRASDDGQATVTARQTLLLRAIGTEQSGDDSGTVEYWRVEEPIGSTSMSQVAPGQAVQLSFERNISQARLRMQSISERLGGTPGTTQMLVVTTVTIRGQINGNDVSRTERYQLPIEVDGSTYRPGEQSGEQLSGSTTERVTRQQTYGPLWRIGGPVTLALGLVALLGSAYGRYSGRLGVSEPERDLLEFQSARAEFEEWVTIADPPSTVLDRPRIEVDSLEGLVDTASDVNARVFEMPDDDMFYVHHGDVLYVYEPPSAGLESMVEGEGDVDNDGDRPEDSGSEESPDAGSSKQESPDERSPDEESPDEGWWDSDDG